MKKVLIAGFILLFAIFFINTFHEEYPDEYDSLVGGRYILLGKLPYRDWFQHHQPLAYSVAAGIQLFTGQSFVRFRMAYAVLLFAFFVATYLLVKKRTKEVNTGFYVPFLFAVALAGTYFWGQMLLADTLAAYLIIPGYGLLLLKSYSGGRFERKDLLIVSLSTFLTWFTSMTFTYVIVGLNLYACYLYWKSEGGRVGWLQFVKNLGIVFLVPYIIFFAYLLITGSLKDYYFANIVYNQKYYIYNYLIPEGGRFNPLRYAVIISNAFVNNYFPALWGVNDFSFSDPIQVTLAVSNAGLFILFLVKRRFEFLFAFFSMLVFSNSRSNPQAIRETDYQSSMYIVSSMFNGLFALFAFRKILDEEKLIHTVKTIATVMFMILAVYWFFNGIFLFMKFEQKFFPKYMGQAPFIYDHPQVAKLVNQMVGDNDTVWIGPFEFKELFYLKTKELPSKYHWFLKQAAVSKIKDEMIADFEISRPKVIVFKRAYSPWAGDAVGFNYFFTDFLDKHYVRLCSLNTTLVDYSYEWTTGDPRNFQLGTDINFDASKKDEILAELEAKGLLKKGPKTASTSPPCIEKE